MSVNLGLVTSAQLKQDLNLMPQLFHSLEVLQKNSRELLEYLNAEFTENPAVEISEASKNVFAEHEPQFRSIRSGARSREDTSYPEAGREDQHLTGLRQQLLLQLARLSLPKKEESIAQYMIESLDDNGYFMEDDYQNLLQLHIPESLVCRALEAVQSLEPAGIGARNLQECLCLQLRRMPSPNPKAEELVCDHLDALGKHRYKAIASALGISLEEVIRLNDIIRELDPHPGKAEMIVNTRESLYIIPDLFVVKSDRGLMVELNEAYIPKVFVSPYYLSLYRESADEELKAYLKEKIGQAKELIANLERRSLMLQCCGEIILDTQRAFFEGNSKELVPMSMTDLARDMHLSVSTISRTVKGKYLQCQNGTYPLKFFFQSKFAEGLSGYSIQQRITEYIRGEDPHHPLSDRAIVEKLSEEEIYIARRTVTKYRMQAGIASSSVRREVK